MLYIKIYLTTAFTPLIIFFFIGLYIQPVSGDLTRLGSFAERDFGGSKKHSRINIFANPSSDKPEVIVLGDSFSIHNQWQSVAISETNLDFVTYHWSVLENPNCLESWINAVKENQPSVKKIIIQLVERSVVKRFSGEQNSCIFKNNLPLKINEGYTLENREIGFQDIMPAPIYALKTIMNSLQTYSSKRLSGQTIIAPLKRSDLFTNKKSNLLLYYHEDEKKKQWLTQEIEKSVEHIKYIENVSINHGLEFVLVIVPDKSTVYSEFLKSSNSKILQPDLWRLLDNKGVTRVNLEKLLMSQVTIKDLYLPNDTHLSSSGYQLMGKEIAKKLNHNFNTNLK